MTLGRKCSPYAARWRWRRQSVSSWTTPCGSQAAHGGSLWSHALVSLAASDGSMGLQLLPPKHHPDSSAWLRATMLELRVPWRSVARPDATSGGRLQI